ncbi:Protein BOI2 [Colletotrichum chlorophyti]|uniref:Protein BOI2 n=1 Tax=Colletotrichum chlorophyti TaxID=708187 RepID=A0A1Q8RD97_9PEZI|nr:Protein BOI2 [Colletotrichum chlorophyti]
MAAPKPEVGDILLVIHDFIARSSDELSLAKGDRVELIERDDEFGDGWFLGKHLVNGNSGLFPEVYTRPAPKTVPTNNFSKPLATLPEVVNEPKQTLPAPSNHDEAAIPTAPPAPAPPAETSPPITLPLNNVKQENAPIEIAPPAVNPQLSSLARLNTNQDYVLNETLNVIDEHITDLRSAPSNGALRAPPTDSGSEYSAQLDHRMSYIHGEETDEEEEGMHSRAEVEAWSPDEVAEYLFTAGVEKSHCEVFRDQEITGEVLLGMDQSSLFIKAFELGSVGRRLKTWQKIKSLQDECNNLGTSTRRTTQTYGSDVGSDDAKRSRSRADTVTSSMPRMTPVDDRTMSFSSKRLSFSQTPKLDTASIMSPVSPIVDSPTRPSHMKRPSAASVRDLHHSRRHSSSTDFRLTGTTVSAAATPKLVTSGTFPQVDPVQHKKQPSFDRNWTLGGASQRPLSSTGLQDIIQQSGLHAPESTMDSDRGYFSGTEVDGRRRNVLRKRDSNASQTKKNSYADEQRARSGTAISKHSRFESIDSTRDGAASPAAQKYYGLPSTAHRRTASTSTTQSTRPAPPVKDVGAPSVTKLEGSVRNSPVPQSPAGRQGVHAEWLSAVVKPSVKVTGLRAISDSVSGDRKKMASPSPVDSSLKDSPLPSPARTGSSTPSAGPSFELDSPDAAKSPSTATTVASKTSKKKGKKETSAYQRGLLKISPSEAVKDADYSGWMRKKSSNLMTTWKPRLFVLKGRRLAYYYSENDDQEKGLIDISFHRVLPADNERLTGLHATLTGAGTAPARESDALEKGDDGMFIFKLVPPRAGLSRAVNFTKPMVHYFAVPNLKQGRLWMAALMKATIDRDDNQAITTTYQQKTISLAKARQMRHRPPALMNLDDASKDEKQRLQDAKENPDSLGISFGEADSGVSGLEKSNLPKVESANPQKLAFEPDNDGTADVSPLSA